MTSDELDNIRIGRIMEAVWIQRIRTFLFFQKHSQKEDSMRKESAIPAENLGKLFPDPSSFSHGDRIQASDAEVAGWAEEVASHTTGTTPKSRQAVIPGFYPATRTQEEVR
jgi:hypothetical protein